MSGTHRNHTTQTGCKVLLVTVDSSSLNVLTVEVRVGHGKGASLPVTRCVRGVRTRAYVMVVPLAPQPTPAHRLAHGSPPVATHPILSPVPLSRSTRAARCAGGTAVCTPSRTNISCTIMVIASVRHGPGPLRDLRGLHPELEHLHRHGRVSEDCEVAQQWNLLCIAGA